MHPTKDDVRTKGQVWTPSWLGDAMALYVLADSPNVVHEPSLGSGSLALSVAKVARATHRVCDIMATELHAYHLGEVGDQLEELGCELEVEHGDFLSPSADGPINAIIANPPYIRHHQFDGVTKARLQSITKSALGIKVDGRTGYHVFFLARAIERMNVGARGCFILPADVFEGVSSRLIMTRITEICELEAVARFAPDATPFPKIDTNPVVIFFKKGGPTTRIACATIMTADSGLYDWVARGFPTIASDQLVSYVRTRDESIATGLTREPRAVGQDDITLGELLTTTRGIATGNNAYFTMTRAEAHERNIPATDLKRCIGKTKDIQGHRFDDTRLETLDREGRATYLLDVTAQNKDAMHPGTRAYIEVGEQRGIPTGTLATARPRWWRMDRREPPPILFSYLGRASSTFYRNATSAVALNGFIGVYPRHGIDPDSLAHALDDPRTRAALRYEAKTYGRGDIKIEPNAIERVTISRKILIEHGVKLERIACQPSLFD